MCLWICLGTQSSRLKFKEKSWSWFNIEKVNDNLKHERINLTFNQNQELSLTLNIIQIMITLPTKQIDPIQTSFLTDWIQTNSC